MGNRSGKKIPHVHFENLDALRFFAALSVFLFHFSADISGFYPSFLNSKLYSAFEVFANKGTLGVNFFFVLSGFLITYLILHEKKHKSHFSLRKFLIRRTLRIWPLYYIIALIGFLLFPVLIEDYSTAHEPILYVFFLANLDEIYHGANDAINFLTSPWSVAVEEQFYLFWGIALFTLFKINKFKTIHLIGLLYLVSFIFRAYYMNDERILYYHTLSVMQDLLAGTFIGLSLFQGKKWLDKLKSMKKPWVLLCYLLGIAICVGKNKLFIAETIIIERFVLSLFFAFIILDQIRGEHSFYKFGKIKIFNYLGRISYGLYMYHLVVMFLILNLLKHLEVAPLQFIWFYFFISITATIGAASISYYLIEKPLLKLKPK